MGRCWGCAEPLPNPKQHHTHPVSISHLCKGTCNRSPSQPGSSLLITCERVPARSQTRVMLNLPSGLLILHGERCDPTAPELTPDQRSVCQFTGNQDIFVGYLCLRALHVQPSDAHLRPTSNTSHPLQSAHTSLQAIQWKCNHAQLLNSALKVQGSLGHVHTPHTLPAVLRGTTDTHSLPRMFVLYWRASTVQQD